MKPTDKLLFLALIIFLLFGTVPTVRAVEPTAVDFTNATAVTCADPPISYSGEIKSPDQVDYYSIDLLANQVLTIDVDAEIISSSLDSLLEVFDSAGNLVGLSDDDRAPEEGSFVDPYLEITGSPDGEATYYLAISASSNNNDDDDDDGGNGGNTGPYTFFLTCSDPTNPPNPVEPVQVGDLLGATGSNPGSLLTINPGDATSSLRFPLEIGPIADIEFDPSRDMLLATINENPGSIITIDPNEGTQGEFLNLGSGAIIALEAAGDTLYGVHVSTDEKYSLVTIDQETGVVNPVVESLEWPVWSLAYHSLENAIYGVAPISGPSDLVKIDLTVTPPQIEVKVQTGNIKIVALDFDPNNILYGITAAGPGAESGKLIKIPDLTTGQAEEIGSISTPTGFTTQASETDVAAVSGLTFVVGNEPPVEPIKTICSSSLAGSITTSSQSCNRKLSKFKLGRNPLHRAIGLFKFQGKALEKVTIRVWPEEEEPPEAGEDSTVTGLEELWPCCKGKGRVFLGLRDKIEGVDLRVKKKGTIPMDLTVEQLPADGSYYIMVIRPLPRFYRTDYCLSLESPDSQIWESLQLAWPGDDTEEDSTTTSAEVNVAEPQNDEGAVVAASTANEPDSGSTVNEPATVSPEETAINESAAETPVVEEPAGDTGSQDTQAVDVPAVDETGEDSTDEYLDDTMLGAPPLL